LLKACGENRVALTFIKCQSMVSKMTGSAKNKARIGLVVVIAILCLALVYYLSFVKRMRLSVENTYTTVWFSAVNFQAIEARMTASEIRNLLGIPLYRQRWPGAGWHWIYSQPLSPDKPYKKFVVVFDNDTARVLRTFQALDRLVRDENGTSWVGLVHQPVLPWEITDFNYPMIQGQPPVVKGEARKTYLLQLMATWCRPCTAQRRRIEQLIKRDFSGTSVQLLLVSIDKNKEALRAYLREHQVTAPVAWDPNGSLTRRTKLEIIPQYLILKDNIISPFGFVHYRGESEEYFDDLAWFINYHAGQDSASNEIPVRN